MEGTTGVATEVTTEAAVEVTTVVMVKMGEPASMVGGWDWGLGH